MKIERDRLIFSSGRTAYANCGIVGIDSDGCPTEGYDGYFDPHDQLTAEDMRELADYMIER